MDFKGFESQCGNVYLSVRLFDGWMQVTLHSHTPDYQQVECYLDIQEIKDASHPSVWSGRDKFIAAVYLRPSLHLELPSAPMIDDNQEMLISQLMKATTLPG